MLGFDADARVLHGEVRAILVPPPAQPDLPAGGRVLDGIEHQVGKGATQFGLAAAQRQAPVDVQFDAVLPLGGQRERIVADRLQQGRHVHRFGRRRRGGGFELGQQQEVVEQVLHASRLLVHLLQRPRPAGVQFFAVFEHGFQVAGDHGQRGSQLVGYVGDEVLAHLFQLVETGDVADHHQVFGVAVTGDVVLQPETVVGRRRQLQRFFVPAAVEVVLEGRVTNQVGDQVAGILRFLQAQQPLGGRIPPLQIAFAVEHDHRFLERGSGALHAIDDGLQLGAPAQVTALQMVEAVEDVAPDAMAVRRWCIGLAALEPLLQTPELSERPAEIAGQAQYQRPGVFAGNQPEQQATAQQQQETTYQGA